MSESILAEYRLRSFLPWLASISLDVAVGGDVVQDPAQVIFIISKNHHCTKPTVILSFSTPAAFQLRPTVVTSREGLRQVYDGIVGPPHKYNFNW